MWVNRKLFERMTHEIERLEQQNSELLRAAALSSGVHQATLAQKAKDDITIDWMRHRVNELTKHNAILLAKAAGIAVPVPEIVPTRPGSMTIPDFDSMPSFEDVGDDEARRLGVTHDDEGRAVYTK